MNDWMGGVHTQNLEVTLSLPSMFHYLEHSHMAVSPAREAGKGGLAMWQDVNKKDLCQSIAVCATYPIHSD